MGTTSESIVVLNRHGEREELFLIPEMSSKIADVLVGKRINAYGEKVSGVITIKSFEIVD